MSDDAIGKITFREAHDGAGRRKVFLVGDWPDRAWITAELLADAGSDWTAPLSRSGDVLHIKCENGEATYLIGAVHDTINTLHLLHKISASRDGAQPCP